MCFFAESALAETYRRDVILYALRKKVDMGYCRKLFVVRERGLTASSKGERGRIGPGK